MTVIQIDSVPASALTAAPRRSGGDGAWMTALLRDIDSIDGFLPPEDAVGLALAATNAQPGTWVEVGSYKGKSSVLLGVIHRHYNKGHVLWCIDPHEGNVPAPEGGMMKAMPTFEAWHKNVAQWGLTLVCQAHIGTVDTFERPARIPFAFIDGLHDRANVLHDAETLLQAMDAGCLLAFHDYHFRWPGVKQAVDYLCARGKLRFSYLAGTVAVCEVL